MASDHDNASDFDAGKQSQALADVLTQLY